VIDGLTVFIDFFGIIQQQKAVQSAV
jgi:hypothetical protein